MRRKNTQMTTNILIVSLLLIGVVYALLQTNLQIDGIAKILHNTWDVHFDNIQVNEDSVPIGENDSQATIDPENNCKIDFEVTLSLPGDFYEFTVDVVNEGTIDGMIGEFNKTLKVNNEVVEETPDYLNYTITYYDGVEIEEHHKLSAGTTESYLVRLEFKSDIEELPQATTIFTSLIPQYIQADSSAITVIHPKSLYNIFKEEYDSGSGLVREYTGEHHDSYIEEPSSKIYHWYGSNDVNGTTIQNKNNIIFANHCWQMIRTTDTGGIKLIYNGEAVEEKCLDTRPKHEGYSSYTYAYIYYEKWYGTDYIYDTDTKKYTLTGEKEKKAWNATTGPGLVGKYTCLSGDENEACSTMYIIVSYQSSSNAYVIQLKSETDYSQIGTIVYSISYSKPTYIGYMTGDQYETNAVSSTTSERFTKSSTLNSGLSFNSNYKYSKTININGSNYELVDPILGSEIPENNYIGYYSFRSTTTTSGPEPYYIVGKDSSWYYAIQLSNANQLNYYNIMIGDSIVDNLDGTYSLEGTPDPVTPIDWFTNYANYNNKYTCGNTTTTCSDPKYIVSTTKNNYSYIVANETIMIGKARSGLNLTDTLLVQKKEFIENRNNYSNYKYTCNTNNAICEESSLRMIVAINDNGYQYVPNYYYGSSVTWDGNKYTLVDTIELENYNKTDMISNHHYICVTPGNKNCDSVAYVYYYTNSGRMNYVTLQDGITSVSKILENSLAKADNNSIIKLAVDSWYHHNLINYDNYIEETIFCDDRSITNLGGWGQNGDLSTRLIFKNSDDSLDLSCANITDQFSVSNPGAQLTYKVGLITKPEMLLLNNKNARKTGKNYWLLSPKNLSTRNDNVLPCINYIPTDGTIGSNSVNSEYGIRPSISLKPGIKYVDGDGSKDNPYIIMTD